MKNKRNLQKWKVKEFTKKKSEKNLQKWKVREIYKNEKWEKFTKMKSENNLQKWKVRIIYKNENNYGGLCFETISIKVRNATPFKISKNIPFDS